MSKAKKKQGFRQGYVPVYMQDEIPQATIKPKNWITKILWNYIKLDVKVEMINGGK